MQHHISPLAIAPANGAHRRSPARGRRRLRCVLTVLGLGLLFCGAPHCASADIPPGDIVYLYTSGGSVDVTSTYYNVNSQDYLVLNGNSIAVALGYEDGHVYDLVGNIIGFINYLPPPSQ
jgi:hypothetical protein